MVRLLWCWVMLLVTAGSLAAQAADVRLQLSSGRILHGEVTSIDSKKVLFHGPDGYVTIPLAEVVAILGEGEEPGPHRRDEFGAPEEPGSSAVELGDEMAPGPDRELTRFLDRYLWFVPHSNGQRSSLGAAVLVVLVLLVQLAARMANLEERSFGRAAGLAVLILAMVAAEVTYVPLSPVLIAAIAGLDMAVWFAAGMALYRADLFQTAVLLVSLMLCSMVSVVLLQLAGVLVHANQLV